MSVHEPVAETTVINGIDVAGVRALIEAVQDDSRRGMTNWKVSSAWRGGTRSRAQIEGYGLGGNEIRRQFSIDIDEPAELGGTNAFPNPQEHLIAALNACLTVGYAAICSLQGIRLDKLEIVTEGAIDLRGFLGLDEEIAPGYETLKYSVTIKGDATPEQFAKIHEMVMATSPNFYNVSRAIPIQASLVVE